MEGEEGGEGGGQFLRWLERAEKKVSLSLNYPPTIYSSLLYVLLTFQFF